MLCFDTVGQNTLKQIQTYEKLDFVLTWLVRHMWQHMILPVMVGSIWNIWKHMNMLFRYDWLEHMKTDEHIWNHMLLLFVMNVWTHENLWNIWLLSWLFDNIWTHMNTYVVWASWVGKLWKPMDTYETVLCLTWLVGNIWKHMKQIWTYMLVLTWFGNNRLKHMKTCVHMLCWAWLVGNIWKQLLFLTWMVGHIWKPFKTYVVVATVGWKHMKHMSTYENIWANAHNQSTTCFCCRCDSLACRNRILIFEKGIMWTCVHNVWGKISIWFWLTPCFFHHIGFGVTHIWHIMFFDHDLFKPGDAFLFLSEVFRSVGKSDSRVPKQACDRVSRRIICFHVAPRLFRILECFHSCQGLEVFSVWVCVDSCYDWYG